MPDAARPKLIIRQARDQDREALAVLEVNTFRSNLEEARKRIKEADLSEILCLLEDGRGRTLEEIQEFLMDNKAAGFADDAEVLLRHLEGNWSCEVAAITTYPCAAR